MSDGRQLPQVPPKVSVLMTVHNGERYLSLALHSILEQTFSDFELVIVDDASTDRTSSLLDSCNDPRVVRYRNDRNLGLTKSLNVGLHLARGIYVARMDADDVSHPERLAIQHSFLQRRPDYVLVGSSYRLVNESGECLLTNIKPMDDLELRWVSHMRTALEHSSVMFRRLRSGGEPYLYDESYRTAQDYEFWLRLMKDGKGCVLDEVLLDYRVHPANITATNADSQLENLQKIAVKNATETYDLSAGAQRQILALSRVYLGRDSFTDSEFTSAVQGLTLLTGHFISRQMLSKPAARFICARAAGQLWYGVLRRRKFPARPGVLRLIRLLWIGRHTLPALFRRILSAPWTVRRARTIQQTP